MAKPAVQAEQMRKNFNFIRDYLAHLRIIRPRDVRKAFSSFGRNVSRQKIHQILRRLCKLGFMVQVKRGEYQIAGNVWRG